MTYTIITPKKPAPRYVTVYCGNYTGYYPYSHCQTTSVVELPPNPKDDDAATYTCIQCGIINTIAAHRTDIAPF